MLDQNRNCGIWAPARLTKSNGLEHHQRSGSESTYKYSSTEDMKDPSFIVDTCSYTVSPLLSHVFVFHLLILLFMFWSLVYFLFLENCVYWHSLKFFLFLSLFLQVLVWFHNQRAYIRIIWIKKSKK